MTAASPDVDEVVETSADTRTDDPWVTIVWNDPVNLMSYVSYVFETYFGHPRQEAERLMQQVHTQGRAVVSRGTLEAMEVDVQAMHGFGLWATFQRSGQ
ncbi:ATP-dependent Clp protease adapter ClpS [Cellulomonas composti]|uniref:ATP-dependent Clp protease adapter protein ClpS n=1 Tax=Cellulomonas composti TaxID=266130 RepID=A0A511J9V6_9CELL|nr:ATP-dependent Clp protease adapter ClpS [Cellulomonas composti]GEL94762.1 ATP-dependent Clp protease adapter protein ClpS [Cellulomonas composti]